MRKSIVTVICLSLLAGAARGQAAELPRPAGQELGRPGASPAFSFHRLHNVAGQAGYGTDRTGAPPEIRFLDTSGVLKLIVEFKEQPLLVAQIESPGRAPSAAFYQSRFNQFAADLESACQSSAGGNSTSSMPRPAINGRFFKLFFGASIEVPGEAADAILGLPYVKGLYIDQEVKPQLEDVVPLIRADQVWSSYGNQGEGVTVAIIDSGIDYTHPALGGGFGPGFKVVGGYDVINDDADPLDDYGHGTHVAGIVAADGAELTGVAPKCSLMAFKVMGQFGQGTLSTVMGGVERAIDPNGDGDPSDRVDVMNLSLGGMGHPNDPLSRAVDNAVRLGAAVCVSAGNEGGLGFWTVGTPGCARLAITVGASDKLDEIASFSSSGPVVLTNAIKPDVIAPGVDIRSSLPGGAYQPMSGTSMSAPVVAGVCALLKSIHPSWSPQQIKAALMTTAVDLGEEVMRQGAGRIDALSAAAVGTLASPSHLSFGISDLKKREWSTKSDLTLRNVSSTAQQYTISVTGRRAGARLTTIPSRFTLAPGQSQEVTVALTVDNRTVPLPKEGSLAYGGSVVIDGTSDKLHVPWAFVMGSEVELSSNKRFPDFILTNSTFQQGSWRAAAFGDGTRYSLTMPAGSYDLMSICGPAWWVPGLENRKWMVVTKEDVSMRGPTRLEVDFDTAVNKLVMEPVDHEGRPLSSVPETADELWLLMFPRGSVAPGMGFANLGNVLHCSNVSSAFKFIAAGAYRDLTGERTVHLVQHLISDGVRGDLRLANSPSDFVAQKVTLKFSPRWTQPGVDFGLYASFGGALHLPTPVSGGSWNGTLYLMNGLGQDQVIGVAGTGCESTDPAQPVWMRYFTPPIQRSADGRVGAYSGRSPSPVDYLVPNGTEMVFGTSPVIPSYESYNNVFGESIFYTHGFLLGPGGEDRVNDAQRTTYAIRDKDGMVVVEGENVEWMSPIALRPGRYNFEVVVDETEATAGSAGLLRFTTDFDLRKADPHPPVLTSLKLLNQSGLPVDDSEGEVPVKVRLSAGDFTTKPTDFGIAPEYVPKGLESTRLFYRACGSETWTALPLRKIQEDRGGSHWPVGFAYEADWPQSMPCPSGRVDLKCVVRDKNGNTTECVLEPAYERVTTASR